MPQERKKLARSADLSNATSIAFPLSGAVTEWIRAWGQSVGQFGLININAANSADPELERDIMQRFSYGRQLGRIVEMLTPLVERNKPLLVREAGASAVDDFEEMASEIRQLKGERSSAEIVDAVRQWKIASRDSFPARLSELLRQLGQLVDEPVSALPAQRTIRR